MSKTITSDRKPATLAEAKKLIEKIFREQGKKGWDATERMQYFAMIGVAGMETENDIRAIIADMVKCKMLIY